MEKFKEIDEYFNQIARGYEKYNAVSEYEKETLLKLFNALPLKDQREYLLSDGVQYYKDELSIPLGE